MNLELKKLSSNTKQCPYCAETIKAAAIVCRFCGRDLKTGKPPQLAIVNETPLDDALAEYISKGWQVQSRTDTSFHIKKPKAWSGLLIVGGLLLLLAGLLFPALFIVGIAFLLLSVIDHLIRSEKTAHVTLRQIEDGTAPNPDTDLLAKWLVGLTLFAVGLYALSVLIN